VLVLVDDVDLLEGYQSAQQNASVQRSRLAEALGKLHFQPGVDVVLTARSWYANSQKNLQTLVDLARSDEMRPEELVAIHDRHMTTYAKKAGFSRFLKPEALNACAEKVRLPGVFLHHLHTAFDDYQNDDDWAERDFDWFLSVFRRLFTNFRNKCAPAAEMLERAVRDGRLEMDVSERNPFYGTVFDNQLVFQSFYNEKCYFASPLVKEILAPLGIGTAPSPEGKPA
jgi:hypothetical protein